MTRKKLTSKVQSAAHARKQSKKSKLRNQTEPQGDNLAFGPVVPLFPADVVLFYNFKDPNLTDEQLEAHPVMDKINLNARAAAWKIGRPELWRELADEGFIVCRKQGKYSGLSSLDAYLYTVLYHKALAMVRPLVPGKFEYVKHDDETPEGVAYSPWRYDYLDDEVTNPGLQLGDSSTLDLQDKILNRIYMEDGLKKLAARSDLHQVIVEMVRAFITGNTDDDDGVEAHICNKTPIRNKETLSDRSVARMASKKLGREVKRYQAKSVLEEFGSEFYDLLPPNVRETLPRSAFFVRRVHRGSILPSLRG